MLLVLSHRGDLFTCQATLTRLRRSFITLSEQIRATAEITPRALFALGRGIIIDRVESETQVRDLFLADYPESQSSEAAHSGVMSIAKKDYGTKL